MKKFGFTLIELLVVIAIIGILITIGTANLITAQRQARDASRREIIQNIQTAFEQYYTIGNAYPLDQSEINAAFENGSAPIDPKNSGANVLSWDTDSDSYCVCAMLEAGTGNASNSTCTWDSSGSYYCAVNQQ